MILRITYFMSTVVLLAGCEFGSKQTAMQKELDSLKTELLANQQVANTLEEVGVLMDSIDANRNLLRTTMLEGTSYDQYLSRMRDLNEYVKSTEDKIKALEASTKSSRSASRNYASTIKKLKAELESRNSELAVLQDQVNRYRNENENLIKTVELQTAELAEKISMLDSSGTQIITLEKQVSDMISQSKIDQGEAYYLRAQAVETAANRTKFAPRKRKETREEALELYRLAAFYGKSEAEHKIEELKGKL